MTSCLYNACDENMEEAKLCVQSVESMERSCSTAQLCGDSGTVCEAAVCEGEI